MLVVIDTQLRSFEGKTPRDTIFMKETNSVKQTIKQTVAVAVAAAAIALVVEEASREQLNTTKKKGK